MRLTVRRKVSQLVNSPVLRLCAGLVLTYCARNYQPTQKVPSRKYVEHSSHTSARLLDQVDVVLVSGTLSCTIEEVVRSHKRFLQGLRHIYIVLPVAHMQECTSVFNTRDELISAHSVSCVSEVSVLKFESLNFQKNALGWQARSDRRHWYYQQLLKLTAFMNIHGLTEDFLIWDADNILLKPFSPKHEQKVRFLTRTENQNTKKCVNATDWTDKQIEKYVYWPATKELLSHGSFSTVDVRRASRPDIVVHQMLFNQRTLRALLIHICDLEQGNATLTPTQCSNNILSSIPRNASNRKAFSEYHLYFTWFVMTSDMYFIDCIPYQRFLSGLHCTKLESTLTRLREERLSYAVVETRSYDYSSVHAAQT